MQSVRGEGSIFTLVLPLSVLTLTLPAEEPPPEFEAPKGGVIIVAEDHDDSRKTLAKVLRRMGYHVLEASNGHDVLDFVRQERPLAILMDINMPGLDGVEATLLLRADPRYQDLPIFALTGDVTLDNQHRIGEAGVNGYVSKKPVAWDPNSSRRLGSLTQTPRQAVTARPCAIPLQPIGRSSPRLRHDSRQRQPCPASRRAARAQT